MGHLDLVGGVFQRRGGAVFSQTPATEVTVPPGVTPSFRAFGATDQRGLHIAWLELSAIWHALRLRLDFLGPVGALRGLRRNVPTRVRT